MFVWMWTVAINANCWTLLFYRQIVAIPCRHCWHQARTSREPHGHRGGEGVAGRGGDGDHFTWFLTIIILLTRQKHRSNKKRKYFSWQIIVFVSLTLTPWPMWFISCFCPTLFGFTATDAHFAYLVMPRLCAHLTANFSLSSNFLMTLPT